MNRTVLLPEQIPADSCGRRVVFCRATLRPVLTVLALVAALQLWLLPALGNSTTYASASRERDPIPTLKLKKLTEFAWPSGGSYLEGGCALPQGYLVSFLSRTAGKPNPLLLLNTTSIPWPVARTSSAMLSHSNDMCYIPQEKTVEQKYGEIFVTPMDRREIVVLREDTLGVARTISTPQNYHAIGYDSVTDQFAAVYETVPGVGRHLICDILDGRELMGGTCVQPIRSFSVDMNLTYQGLAVHDSLIYYTGWDRGGVNSVYQPVHDNNFEKHDNVIYVYDFSGKLVRKMLVTLQEGYEKLELETVSFIQNRMILQFNATLEQGTQAVGTDLRRIVLYEVTGEGVTAAEDLAAKQKAAAEKAAAEKAAAEKKAAEEKAAREKKEREEREAAQRKAAAKQKAKLAAKKPTVKVTARKKKSLKFSWKKVKNGTPPVTGYEVQICRKKNFRGKSLKTIKTTGLRCTVKKLKRRTTYYVRVRACQVIGGKTCYSAWSKRKKVRTK